MYRNKLKSRFIKHEYSNLSNYQRLDHSIYQVPVLSLSVISFQANAYLNLQSSVSTVIALLFVLFSIYLYHF